MSETSAPKSPIKTIVVGYDDTEPAKRALGRAAELAKAFGAGIVVTSVARPLALSNRGVGPVDPADPPSLHREELERAGHELSELGLEAELEVAFGPPAERIVALAERRHADLIVVGTREPDLLERLFGLSVSDAVEHRAHCDVLIVH
jgi:nucleotide-binding universal stress UspA family protein